VTNQKYVAVVADLAADDDDAEDVHVAEGVDADVEGDAADVEGDAADVEGDDDDDTDEGDKS
jgi:hypothetical protein